MRIHSLELCAYGPFPDKIEIDFEDLNEAGIFLLNGPTGSGKSSILDAICFALYGTTSMNRPDLRSHFAAENVEPYVRLEFEVQGERYRIWRSPQWERPKKRKTGTSRFVREQAKADLDKLNLLTGEWEDLTDRPAEAGDYMTQLMGLTREQFTQVMLLPQGEFARFLLSSSKDREELLKKLFSTLEFERIQEVLKTLAKEAQEKVSQQESAVEQLKLDAAGAVERAGLSTLDGIQQRALELLFGENLPAEFGVSEVVEEFSEETDDEFESYLKRNIETIISQEEYTDKVVQRVATEYESRVKAHDHLAQLAKDWTAHERLLAQKAQLSEQSEEMSVREQTIDKALAARAVLQPARNLEVAQTRCETNKDLAHQAQAALGQALEVPKAQSNQSGNAPEQKLATLPKDVKAFRTQVTQTSQELEKLVEQEKLEKQLGNRVKTLQKSLETLSAKLTDASTQEEEIRVGLRASQEFIDEHRSAEADEAHAKHAVSDAQQRLKTAQKLADLRTQTKDLEKAFATANTKREKAVVKVNDLYHRRFLQATVVLAEELKDGEPCAVCGSLEHPQPAVIEETGTAIEERHITKAQTDRETAEENANRAFAALDSHQKAIATLVEDGALELDAAEEQLAAAQSLLKQAKSLTKKLVQTQKKLEAAQAELEKHLEAVELDKKHATENQALLTEAKTEHDQVNTYLQGQASQLSFAQRLEHVHHVSRALETAIDADSELVHAQQNLEHAKKALEQALTESKFESVADAKLASMTQTDLVALQEKVRAYREAVTVNKTQLASDAQVDIASRIARGETAPTEESISQAAQGLGELQSSVSALTQARGYLSQSKTSLKRIQSQYAKTLLHFADLLEDARIKRHLADTANGTDPDNTLKMTLTTFVLASQLAEVARAASQHLDKMTHGRYQLKHSDARKGHGKSGLDIVVHDAWHSKNRAAASLSGGETFMASLSLALGLADVVQARNGGIDIATLFVDEGFGTLDDATLEEVMSTLDGLRERGRVIGLISHVTEMKNRISQQILLTTSPEGSRLASLAL